MQGDELGRALIAIARDAIATELALAVGQAARACRADCGEGRRS